MIYAISDLEGKLPVLKKVLTRIDFKTSDELYILGNVIGRSEQNIETIDYIMNIPNIYIIIGKNERDFINTFTINKDKITLKTTIEVQQPVPSIFTSLYKLSQTNSKHCIKIIEYLKKCESVKVLPTSKLIFSAGGYKVLNNDILEATFDPKNFIKTAGFKNYMNIFGSIPIINLPNIFNFSPIERWFDYTFKNKVCINQDLIHSHKITVFNEDFEFITVNEDI